MESTQDEMSGTAYFANGDTAIGIVLHGPDARTPSINTTRRDINSSVVRECSEDFEQL